MTDTERREWHEWGYALADGTVEWQSDFGTDGSWIVADHGIGTIDIYDGTEASAIYRELDKAGADGIAIKRLVTEFRSPYEPVYRA